MLPDTLQIQDDDLPTAQFDKELGVDMFVARHRRCSTYIKASVVHSLLSSKVDKATLLRYMLGVHKTIDRGDNPPVQLIWALGKPMGERNDT